MKRTICLLFLLHCASPSFSQMETIALSHYLFPDFVTGRVLLKDGTVHTTPLNYNTLTEEVVFQQRGEVLAMADEIVSRIDTLFIGARKFVRMDDRVVELLHHGKYTLYAEHKCRVNEPGKPAGYGGTSRTSSTTSYSSYQSGGLFYALKLPDGFEVKPYVHYRVKKNGETSRVMSMRQLERLFSDRRDQFRAYMRDTRVQFDDWHGVTGLIRHMEAN